MRHVLNLILVLSVVQATAQPVKTVYYDKDGEVVSADDKFAFYSIHTFNGEKYFFTNYTKKGKPYYSGECKDSLYYISDGIFVWLDEKLDTLSVLRYENDVIKTKIEYEAGNPVFKYEYRNDTSYYQFAISDRKYIIDKKLYDGEMEYYFRGKDSFPDMNRLRFAFRKKGNGSDYYIAKFKMLPWVIGEDVGMSYSLGLEYTFHRIHSFDLTATYFDWDQDQEDNYGNPLPSIYNVRRSLQLGYRYYFNMFKSKKDEWKFFVSPFIRYSKWKDHYSEGAVTDYFRNESWNYAGGILLGFAFDGGTDDGMYTEFFIGPQYYLRKTAEGFTTNNITVENEYYTRKFGVRFGMNFCGLISRKEKRRKE